MHFLVCLFTKNPGLTVDKIPDRGLQQNYIWSPVLEPCNTETPSEIWSSLKITSLNSRYFSMELIAGRRGNFRDELEAHFIQTH